MYQVDLDHINVSKHFVAMYSTVLQRFNLNVYFGYMKLLIIFAVQHDICNS